MAAAGNRALLGAYLPRMRDRVSSATMEQTGAGARGMALRCARCGRPQDVVGCLEYDPELPVRQHYREYLQQGVVFKEVVPISSPAVRAKIHQTYRLGYLKVRRGLLQFKSAIS